MNQKPFIKICGITRLEDAQHAVNSGADAVGFIAYEKSPRFTTAANVQAICRKLPEDTKKVGVFVDADLDIIKGYLAAGINTIQLHGSEDAKFAEICSGIAETWKAIKPTTTEEITSFIDFPVDKFLIDAFHQELQGGTGLTVDRELAQTAVSELTAPVILAGGLNPANFAEILEAVQPFGLDFNSGLEISPGIKDPEKITAVFEQL